ncbi:type VII toxin-antitoxin system MntA family adenylyltransferase antitoxin [Catenovulum agarivorans]|uniref:type VII toxin-antitoxin system MntA family adenylyltransferase antitoxin n=1 Tax=Catenovulum agarivorans TaxID=1172192 RepID=UPI0004BCBB86|nr:nucleotidyltransferase domain-containing protein [Catenovulum agarivorans]
MPNQTIINKIKQLATDNSDVEILWLYGSQARNTANEKSDYDLAIKFKNHIEDALDRRLRPELLAMDWQEHIEKPISIIDITQVDIPLAYAVVMDNCMLVSKNELELYERERIIMSKYCTDYLYHRKHNGE